jgi:hypothetical protein
LEKSALPFYNVLENGPTGKSIQAISIHYPFFELAALQFDQKLMKSLSKGSGGQLLPKKKRI